MQSLTAVVVDTTFRNEENHYTVLRVAEGKQNYTVVGQMPTLGAGENVTFQGEWIEHPVYGKQFSMKTCEITPPTGKNAVEKYLGSGLIKGIGKATAKLIVKHFGDDTMDILDSTPEKLTEVKGIGQKRAIMIVESIRQQMGMRKVLLFLQQQGISPNLSMKIAKYYGENTIGMLKENPYRMVLDIDGIGFLTADRMALQMGIQKNSAFRIYAALFFLLKQAALSMGHTFLPSDQLCYSAVKLLSVSEEEVKNQIIQATLDKKIIAIQTEECPQAVGLPYLYYAEQEVAARLSLLLQGRPRQAVPNLKKRIAKFEKNAKVRFSDKQKTAITQAVEEGILIITGGPGTGKTTLIRCIITLLQEDNEVLLCAPTGRAAKRMSETTGEESKTIHRLLEYGGDGDCFMRNEENPLEADCLIVDEVSMVDVLLMRALLRAILPGMRLILVGDADQLPSVGAGNVLRDLLQSKVVPFVQLTDIFRQDESSMIVLNAHRINQGQMPYLNKKQTDFFFVKQIQQLQTAHCITELMQERLPKYLGYEPKNAIYRAVREIQVLTPMRKGECGVENLNKMLQNVLNPDSFNKESLVHGEMLFRMGDKVMQTKNDYQLQYERAVGGEIEEGTGVYNGDVGFIVHIDPAEHMIEVLFDDDKLVTYQKQQIEALELAYCLTVHKSQGSEFPVVIMPVVGGPPMLMARNLLYTALTRAKTLVVLVGREQIIQEMVTNDHIAKRYTTLCEKIKILAAGNML